MARCGDGIIHQGVEACDDGNDDNTDQCTQRCEQPACGDSFIQDGEVCDDGNANANDACTNACQPARCGDGILFTGQEQCDDGNQNNDDECSNNCELGQAPTRCEFVANRTPLTIRCDRSRNWSQAQRACEDWGGNLITITSLQDHQLIWSAARNQDFWIGLYKNRSNAWVWQGRDTNYRYWQRGQPDDWQNREDCGELYRGFGGRWNDVRCDEGNRYFCER